MADPTGLFLASYLEALDLFPLLVPATGAISPHFANSVVPALALAVNKAYITISGELKTSCSIH
jgi:hypothetical protein